MLFLEDLAARLEALWPADEWPDWIERIPEGPREKRLAFALFALLTCGLPLDEAGDVLDPGALRLWRSLESLALAWTGFTESEALERAARADALFYQSLAERWSLPVLLRDRDGHRREDS